MPISPGAWRTPSSPECGTSERSSTGRAGRSSAGVVVNEHLNVTRQEYDVLKAILHNARVHGPASQNRRAVPDFRAHLLGRIAWVGSLNPRRADKLRHQFAGIDWSDGFDDPAGG